MHYAVIELNCATCDAAQHIVFRYVPVPSFIVPSLQIGQFITAPSR